MPADPAEEAPGPQVPKTELEELQIKAQGVADEVERFLHKKKKKNN